MKLEEAKKTSECVWIKSKRKPRGRYKSEE